ncbi:MAG: hypothetical protein MRY57_02785 [Candidatus Pacebacteria bacterium]|nr:hypothetical protein [Candidatus Paceibacterota bacterium]
MVYDNLCKHFRYYIDTHDEYMTEEEQQAALKSFEKPFNKRVFQLSIILIFWSVIGLTIDTFIIGGSATAAIIKGPAWIQLVPTLIFSAVNWLLKWGFVYWYLKKEVPLGVAFMTGVQYVGFTILLAHTLKHDPEFRFGLKHYIRFLRKKGIRFILGMMKKT